MDQDNLKALQREVLLSFWKIHILYHAAAGPLIGQWMLLELRRHGYDVSPGTLYPIFHRMEALGWLRCETDPERGSRAKRLYYLTEIGKEVLSVIESQLDELKKEAAISAAAGTSGVRMDRATGSPRKGKK
jgi:PadR family transcriptional regulator, regulatory protein PadR